MKGACRGGSKKSPRRAPVTKTHRVLLLIGDNSGGFPDAPGASPANRPALMERHRNKQRK